MKTKMVFLTLCLSILFYGTSAATQFRGGGPQPGDVYKEFTFANSSSNWRVTDPDMDTVKFPEGANFLPNPLLYLSVDDLEYAVYAEVLIDFWGGHEGTINKQFRFNNNSWITIPELHTLGACPSPGNKYMQQVNHLISVPLNNLIAGVNVFEGTSGPNTWGWGQWGWYGLILRVYYDPAIKPHTTGQIASIQPGDTFSDNPTITVNTSGGANRVDVLAYYDGYDVDGDGHFVDYQRHYHRQSFSDPMGIKNHVGTATNSPFAVNWNTQWVPDQATGAVKLLARIRNSSGYWFVTPEITNLTLQRSDFSVKLYKPYNVPQKYWVRIGQVKWSKVNISSLANATDAIMHVTTWNGNERNSSFYNKINNWTAPKYGEDHFWSYDQVPVPLSALKTGENTITFQSSTTHHGPEIMWPGPAISVRYGSASPPPPPPQDTAPNITEQPANKTAVVGEKATFSVSATGSTPLSYQWRKNGNNISGATGSSYTTPSVTSSDDGATFSCRVSNAYGTVTSNNATLSVQSSTQPPSSIPGDNVIQNADFEGGTSDWRFYTNASGSFKVAGPGDGSQNAAIVSINTKGTNVQLHQHGITLEPNTRYQLNFSAYSNTGNNLRVSVLKHGSPYTNYGLSQQTANLSTNWQSYTFNFTTANFNTLVSDARLMFWFANDAAPGDQFYIDNVELMPLD